jgi:hypothetical protein
MPVWSIKIIPSTSGIADEPVAFVPDLPGAKPGESLKVLSGDLVSWNNTTNDTHQPWPTDAQGNLLKEEPDGPVGERGTANYLSDPIPGNASSRPSWTVVQITSGQNTINYCSRKYPKVTGTIVISG